MKRSLCLLLVLIMCLVSVPFASADQEAVGTVVSLESGFLTLKLENGNIVILNCDIETDAAAGDSVAIAYVGKLGISAAVTELTVTGTSSAGSDAFSGTVTEVYGSRFTVTADTGARVTFLINENTTLSGSTIGLQPNMKVSVTFTGEVTGDVYALSIIVTGAPARTAAPSPLPTQQPVPASTSPVKLYGSPVSSVYDLNIGDTVTFGTYEQDGNSRNGKEEIEWSVLDIDGDSVLLLSNYGLDMHVYNNETVRTTWASSSIRAWLNGSFYDSAFTSGEQAVIETTYVDNSASSGSRESLGGPNTNDKVFLLSYQEAWYYLPTPYDRMCAPTQYALSRWAMSSAKYTKDGMNTTYWWLRSSGRTDIIALLVMSNGAEGYDNVSWGHHASDNMYNSGGCIRPAVWVTIN